MGKLRELLDDKKVVDIVILDLQGLSSITDYFVICTATSERHSKAIAEYVKKELRKDHSKLYHIDGNDEGYWIVMDYIDFILHIFIEEIRELYALEKLWGDAKRIE